MLPLRFLLRTVLYAVVLCLFFLPALVVRFPGLPLSPAYVLSHLVDRGGIIFLSAFFLALVASHFQIMKRPGIKILSFGLLILFAFPTLYGGLWGIERVRPLMRMSQETTLLPFSDDRLYRFGDTYLWLGKNDGMSAETILLLESGSDGGGFRMFPEGVYNPETGTLHLLRSGEDIPLRDPMSLRPPAFLQAFFRDLAFFSISASPRSFLDGEAMVFVFALVFFGFSLWTPIRLSRWPLFNIWLTFGIVRLVLAGGRFLGETVFPEVLGSLQPKGGTFVVGGFLILCGMILFLSGLLMKPLSEWKRDLAYE